MRNSIVLQETLHTRWAWTQQKDQYHSIDWTLHWTLPAQSHKLQQDPQLFAKPQIKTRLKATNLNIELAQFSFIYQVTSTKCSTCESPPKVFNSFIWWRRLKQFGFRRMVAAVVIPESNTQGIRMIQGRAMMVDSAAVANEMRLCVSTRILGDPLTAVTVA